ncbi:TPA: restriction endonuclease subunit S [Vibrio parahaemolyticus]|uniref:restriction endonuclease subunit S n=1 Tax=Vibrio parahaemolyticus TaxID=670 RepID=UPI00041B8CCB|nr:restriction endonuclease subunit S [Vibrio parahaemolyticus]
MSKYQAYPKYEPINAEWLSEIPIGWSTTPLKYVASINMGQSPSSEDCNIDGIGVPFLQGNAEFGVKSPTEKQFCPIPKKVAKAGDLLFSVRAPVGSLNFANKDFGIGRGLCSIRGTNAISQSFLWWVLPSYKYQFDAIATGSTFEAVSAEEVGNLNLALPPILEQTQIANFLEHETAKIDTLIEKQEQLIKLLKEKRQAVISHAVTKGLNPQAPMKDSGVEWCDYIPEHWRIGKLGFFARVGNGATPSRENQSFWNGGTVGWLNSSKVNDVIITEAEQFITPLALAQTSVQPVKANDLVIAITGEGQTRGRVAICQLEATINQHLASIRIYDDCLHHEFLFLWLSANYERIRFESTGAGSTKGAITCGDIKSYPIVIAPLSEQTEIINHIKLQNQHFSNLIAKAENQVQLLKERRTALISAAVTGKIDVRNWQAPSTSITKIPEGEV